MRSILIVCIVVGSILVSGCGGSDSKEEYTAYKTLKDLENSNLSLIVRMKVEGTSSYIDMNMGDIQLGDKYSSGGLLLLDKNNYSSNIKGCGLSNQSGYTYDCVSAYSNGYADLYIINISNDGVISGVHAEQISKDSQFTDGGTVYGTLH